MTLHAIQVPKWGLAMEEGTLTSWLVDEGATISAGEEIAEIETSKIANVLESQVTGTLRRQVAAEGDLKPVGALIGVVSDAEEDETAIDAFIADIEARFETEEKDVNSAPTPQQVSVNDRTLRFLKVEGGADVPILLLHGFGGDYLNWMFNQAVLASGRDVYALDLPGHGASSKDVGDATPQFLADTVAAWMDAQGLDTVHLVGHSMGAGIALALALSQPERVKSLVAICGVGFGGTVNADYVEGFLSAQKRKDLKPVVQMLFANEDLVTREMLDDLIAYKRIDGVDDALRLLIDNALAEDGLAALQAQLPELSMPVLALYGEQDRVVATPDASVRPEGAIVIAATGHMPQMEAADVVNGHILAFAAAND